MPERKRHGLEVHTPTGEAEAETGGLVQVDTRLDVGARDERDRAGPVMTGTVAPHPAILRRFVSQCHDDAKETRNQKA